MSAEQRAEEVSEGESEDKKGGICEQRICEEAKKEDKDERESEDKRQASVPYFFVSHSARHQNAQERCEKQKRNDSGERRVGSSGGGGSSSGAATAA